MTREQEADFSYLVDQYFTKTTKELGVIHIKIEEVKGYYAKGFYLTKDCEKEGTFILDLRKKGDLHWANPIEIKLVKTFMGDFDT